MSSTSATPIFPHVLHGGDYNPDQWPESVWDDDVRLMQEAGVNTATLPVFSWVHLQPSEETFTFEWLDRILEKLHQGGIDVCMATSTGSVPAWMDRKYPDILRVGVDGVKQRHGGRHTFCPTSANFRRLSSGLAHALAERYKDYPGLKLWHISNEYGQHCYCGQCEAAFRQWLESRYGSLDQVNKRWYTAFWGHTYTDWSQIESPTYNGERSIQALLIDYDRFQSQSILDCCRAEAAQLRSTTPGVPITTNLMGAFKALDYHKWANELDIVSWDSYPYKGEPYASIAFTHSLMRGLKEGQPFLLMEQTPSQQNWQAQNALKRPGVMRLWSYQAMAHGSDSVMYFQWRRSRGGTEKYHGAVVEHVGAGKPRVFREVATLGAELKALGTRTLGGKVQSRAAILFDWENWWAVEYLSGPTRDLRYVDQCKSYFAALHTAGIPTDVVSPEADLSGYDLVVAPVLYMVKPGIAHKLEEFTAAGGTFVTTFFSGIVDDTDLVYLGGYPGPLRKLLGIWVEEIDALSPNQTNDVVFAQPYSKLNGSYKCSLICERLHVEGARVLATFGSDFYAGEPAVTLNSFGKGRAYYLGTALGAEGLKALVETLAEEKAIEPTLPQAVENVEATMRLSASGENLLYILNHNNRVASVPIRPGVYTDLITNTRVQSAVELAAYGVMILAPA